MRTMSLLLLLSCGPAPEPSPPPSVSILPTAAVSGRDALRCETEADAVQWLVDGVEVQGEGPDGKRISAESTRQGSQWECRVQTDGGSSSDLREVEPLGANILLFLLDDIGVEKIGSYGMLDDAPPQTPIIDGLAETGVRFHRAWSTPVCSPTRATLLTGRYGRRTGLGRIIDEEAPTQILAYDEVFVPEMLRYAPQSYATAMSGKWHLAWLRPRYLDHPSEAAGFDYHTGSVDNLGRAMVPDDQPRGYFRWENNNNGSLGYREEYATDYTVDQALGLTASMPEPWFLYIPFNGAHTPYHDPPDEEVYTAAADGSSPEQFRAMVESMDIAIGRVLAGMDPDLLARTTVFVIGDNGSAKASTLPRLQYAKGSVFESGIRVPFIVNGYGVETTGVSQALVNTVDIFDTIAAMTGADLGKMDAELAGLPRDSVSFLPVLADLEARGREVNYAESFEPNGPGPYVQSFRTVTDGRFKLVDFEGVQTGQLFFDLLNDPAESTDLLSVPLTTEASEAKAALDAQLAVYIDELVYDSPLNP